MNTSQTSINNTLHHLLINRNFALLWSGQAISILGDFIFNTTLVVWIVVVLAKGYSWTPVAVSGIFLAATLPTVLIGPLVGVFVDRWKKRRTMLSVNILQALFVGLLLLQVSIAGTTGTNKAKTEYNAHESGRVVFCCATVPAHRSTQMDLLLPGGMDGIEAIRRVRDLTPHTQVIALTSTTYNARAVAALQAGAISYVRKGSDPSTLLTSLRAAARGQSMLDPAVASAVL